MTTPGMIKGVTPVTTTTITQGTTTGMAMVATTMLTDAAAIAMALGAMWLAGKEASVRRTFGYHRTEVLAALINAGALWVITGLIILEAFTAHILVDPSWQGDPAWMLERIKDMVHKEFGINHATIQLERSASDCTEDHHVEHLFALARPAD